MLAQQGGGGIAVHHRHLNVHQNQVERSLPGQLYGQGSVFGLGHLHLGVAEEGFGNLAVKAVVFDQQHALVAQLVAQRAVGGQCFLRDKVGGRAHGQRQRKSHHRALVRFALNQYVTLHQLQQVAADAEPQPGTAKFAGHRRVGLAEFLKDILHEIRRNAHARIRYLEAHGHAAVGRGFHQVAGNGHLAGFGELNGVAGQVQQHLPDAVGVAAQHGRHGRGHAGKELQALLGGLVLQGLVDFGQQLVGLEANVLQGHLARFELAQVQNVVDDDQQVLGRRGDGLAVAVLVGGQRGFGQQLAHAQDGIHGRADFVAHVGQKQLSGPHRRLGRQLGVAQLLLAEHPRADVDAVGHDDVQRAIGVEHRLQAAQHMAGASRPREGFFKRHQLALACGLAQPGVALGSQAQGVVALLAVLKAVFADNPLAHRRVADAAGIHENVAELGIEHGHVAGHRIQYELIKPALLGQLLLGLALAGGGYVAVAHQVAHGGIGKHQVIALQHPAVGQHKLLA